MMNEVEIIFVFCNIINTYVIFRLMHLFVGERKYSRNIEILSYFTYYIISAGCFYLIHIPIVMLIGNLILFFAISFNYSATGKERILAVHVKGDTRTEDSSEVCDQLCREGHKDQF